MDGEIKYIGFSSLQLLEEWLRTAQIEELYRRLWHDENNILYGVDISYKEI